MKALGSILRKAAQLTFLFLSVTAATFLLSSLIPGDFYSASRLDPIPQETIEQLRRRHGLDQPLHEQYLRWLGSLLRWDLGFSLFYRRPVASVVGEALANTLWLGLPALVIGLLGGMLLGAVHALVRERPFGYGLDLVSTLVISLPTLLLGLGALLLAAASHRFPIGGMSSWDLVDADFGIWLLDRMHHLVLPGLCLTLPILARVERLQCAATSSTLRRNYVRSAMARGLGKVRIFLRYVLRPSVNPVLASSGPLFASVLSGSLVLEVIFSWPGLGQATYNALFSRDLHLLVGCVTASSILLVAGNLAADLLLLKLDPGTRRPLEGGS